MHGCTIFSLYLLKIFQFVHKVYFNDDYACMQHAGVVRVFIPGQGEGTAVSLRTICVHVHNELHELQ